MEIRLSLRVLAASAEAARSECSGEVAADMAEAELPVVVVVVVEGEEWRMVRSTCLAMWWVLVEMQAAEVVAVVEAAAEEEFLRWPENDVFHWLRRLR